MQRVKYILATCLLAACSHNVTDPPNQVDPPVPPVPLKAGITMSATQLLLDNGITSKDFNFAQLRELWVRVTVPKVSEMPMMRLAFTNPKGELIYETTSPFTTKSDVTSMPMPGLDHAISVRQVKPL